MALNKSALHTDIYNALFSAQKETNALTAADNLAKAIADAIDSYVKNMQITYTSGLGNSGGNVTGTFGNTIS